MAVWSLPANLVVALAALVGAIAAWLGVSTWRRELRGKNDYDLARRVLVNVYRIRDAISRARAPYIEPWEYEGRPGRELRHRSKPDPDDLAYAYPQRLKPVVEAESALDVDLLEAQAIWGDLLVEASKKLKECIADLSVSVDHYISAERGTTTFEPDHLRHIRQVIWRSGQGHDDKYLQRLTQAVSLFDETLRGYLQRR